jgi:hypothetical protein
VIVEGDQEAGRNLSARPSRIVGVSLAILDLIRKGRETPAADAIAIAGERVRQRDRLIERQRQN